MFTSLKVVSIAALCWAATKRSATRLRRRDIFSRVRQRLRVQRQGRLHELQDEEKNDADEIQEQKMLGVSPPRHRLFRIDATRSVREPLQPAEDRREEVTLALENFRHEGPGDRRDEHEAREKDKELREVSGGHESLRSNGGIRLAQNFSGLKSA